MTEPLTPLTEEELTRLTRLEAAATRGPWSVDHDDEFVAHKSNDVADPCWIVEPPGESESRLKPFERERHCANMRLIAAARTLLPRALATIAALESARATAYAEGLNAAIAAVWARSLWTVVTYESLYSTRKTDNPACLASDLVKALEALRDTPAPRPPREEGDR